MGLEGASSHAYRKWLIAVIGALCLVGLIVVVIPNISWTSSAGRQGFCLANVAGLGKSLEIYASEHNGRLPASLKDATGTDRIVRCPFDSRKHPEGSYIYVPQGIVLSDGRKIILYCGIRHPEVVNGPGRDPSAGCIPALLTDFSVTRLPLGIVLPECER